MKHCLMILTISILFCACSSAEKADDGYYSYKENGVLEEEFDLLVAPAMDYEQDIPYEQQIQNTGKTNTVKPSNKPQAKPQKQPVTR